MDKVKEQSKKIDLSDGIKNSKNDTNIEMLTQQWLRLEFPGCPMTIDLIDNKILLMDLPFCNIYGCDSYSRDSYSRDSYNDKTQSITIIDSRVSSSNNHYTNINTSLIDATVVITMPHDITLYNVLSMLSKSSHFNDELTMSNDRYILDHFAHIGDGKYEALFSN